MKIKEAIRGTNKSLIEFIKHEHWEPKMAWCYYKNGFGNLYRASKYLSFG